MKKANPIAKLLACLTLAVCVLFSSSVVFAAEADTIPPTAPTNLRYNMLSGYMSVSWTASTDNVGVDHYIVMVHNYVSGDNRTDVTSVPYYSLGSVQENMPSYLVMVTAVDAAGNRSQTVSIRTPGATSAAAQRDEADATPPTMPTNLRYTGLSGYFYINWDASTDNVGVDHYIVTIYYKSQAPQTVITGYNGYMIGQMVPNPDYYRFDVTAVDAAGNRSQTATCYMSF